jgi:hypothetical protein
MSGRASRARLLAPSFVVVISALACGGTISGGADDGSAGSGGSKVAAGGNGYGGYGGTANPPFPVPIAGTNCCINPPMPVCPTLPPANGTGCFGPQTCSYTGPNDTPCPPPVTTATCFANAWQVSTSITSCNPPPTLVCPPTRPMAGTGCFGINAEGTMCVYTGQLCPREDAWCQGGIWHVDACEPLGMGGIGNPPAPVGGAGGAF